MMSASHARLIRFSCNLPPLVRLGHQQCARLCRPDLRSAINPTAIQWQRFASTKTPKTPKPAVSSSELSRSYADVGSWGTPLPSDELQDNGSQTGKSSATEVEAEAAGAIMHDASDAWGDIPVPQSAPSRIADYKPEPSNISEEESKAVHQKELDEGLQWLELREREKILDAAKRLRQKKEHMLMIKNFAEALLARQEFAGVEQREAQIVKLLESLESESQHLETLFEQMADLLAIPYPELIRQSQPEKVDKLTAIDRAEERLNTLLQQDVG